MNAVLYMDKDTDKDRDTDMNKGHGHGLIEALFWRQCKRIDGNISFQNSSSFEANILKLIEANWNKYLFFCIRFTQKFVFCNASKEIEMKIHELKKLSAYKTLIRFDLVDR